MKKFSFNTLILFLLSVFGGGSVVAQVDFSLHLGGSMPLGSYASSQCVHEVGGGNVAWNTESSNQAGAGLGIGLGWKVRINMPVVKGLGIIITGDYHYSYPSRDVKDYVAWKNTYDNNIFTSAGMSGVETIFEVPSYRNIPIILGFDYERTIAKGISVYGEIGAGLNFFKPTRFERSISYTTPTEDSYIYQEYMTTMNYETTTSFAFQIGAGIKLSKYFSLGLHYYNLGYQRLKGNGSITSMYDDVYNADRIGFQGETLNPSMLVLKAGYHF